jgi:hypothetical protein
MPTGPKGEKRPADVIGNAVRFDGGRRQGRGLECELGGAFSHRSPARVSGPFLLLLLRTPHNLILSTSSCVRRSFVRS